MRPNVVAGLDIGSTKTCVVIADVGADTRGRPVVKILGVGQSKTGGMRREVVTDLEETTESIRKAMKEAELMAGVSAGRIWVGVAGEHIHAKTSSGVVAVGGGEVATSDVKRVHEVARAVVVPSDREVLHALPMEYTLDHQSGIHDPVGMAGTRLEAELYIITSSAAATQNLRKAVQRAGYRIEAFVHEPLATGMAVLTDDEKDIGVVLVDLGGGSTEVAVFREGKMRHNATVPWGGASLTNDMVKGLSITFAEAERAKEQYGVAFARLVDPRETIEVPAPGPGARRQVARELIAHILEQRLDEVLGMVERAIDASGEADRLGAGIVFTGGGASLAGTLDVAQHVFGTSVRVGMPGEALSGLVDSIRKPKFATATGLALYGADRVFESGPGATFGEGVIGRAIAWLKEFF